MKRLLFIFLLIVSIDSFAQPGYTPIKMGYDWTKGRFDSALHLPGYNGVPSGVRTGVWVGDGAIAADTANGYIYLYSGGAWIKFAKSSDLGAEAWAKAGNSGTTPGTHFLGTTDAQDFVIKTNGVERQRWGSAGAYQSTFTGLANFFNTSTSATRISASNGTDSSFIEIKRGSIANNYVDIRSNKSGLEGRILVGGVLQGGVGLISTQLTKVQSITAQGDILLSDGDAATGRGNLMHFFNDTIRINPSLGNFKIDTLNYTLSTTGKKIMLRDTVTGLVENIDPALIGGGSPAGNFGNIQINRNGLFDSPGSDSLDFNGGLVVKGQVTATDNVQAGAGLLSKPSYTSDWVAALTYTGNGTTANGSLELRESSTGGGDILTIQPPASIAASATVTTPGTTGTLVHFVDGTTASSATPTPTGYARENTYDITALAADATFAAPSGTAVNHNTLLIRVKDNSTVRALAWNAIYRAGTDIPLPTTTVDDLTMYIYFVYNSADSKWDLVGLTSGF